MSFAFQLKKEALNWDQISLVDLKNIIENTDIEQLESILANITNAKLTQADFFKFGDKNMIKLFKVGQLSLEYLLFAQQYSEAALNHVNTLYLADVEKAVELENQVRRDRQILVNLRTDAKLKMSTLSAYEQMLKTPLGKAQVFKCQICFKYFKDNAFLLQHYERRHQEFYESERFRKQSALSQNQLDTQDLLAAQVQQQKDFFERCKYELIQKYSNNFVDLQSQLQSVTQSNQKVMEQNNEQQNQMKLQLNQAVYSVTEYQQKIEELKSKMAAQIIQQKQFVAQTVQQEIEKYQVEQAKERENLLQQEQAKAFERGEHERKIKEQVREETKKQLMKDFENTMRIQNEIQNRLLETKKKLEESQTETTMQKRLVLELQKAQQDAQKQQATIMQATQKVQTPTAQVSTKQLEELVQLQLKLQLQEEVNQQLQKQQQESQAQAKAKEQEYMKTIEIAKKREIELLISKEALEKEKLAQDAKAAEKLKFDQELAFKNAAAEAERKRAADLKAKQDAKEIQEKIEKERLLREQEIIKAKIAAEIKETALAKQRLFEQELALKKSNEAKLEAEKLKAAQATQKAVIQHVVVNRAGPVGDGSGSEDDLPIVKKLEIAPVQQKKLNERVEDALLKGDRLKEIKIIEEAKPVEVVKPEEKSLQDKFGKALLARPSKPVEEVEESVQKVEIQAEKPVVVEIKAEEKVNLIKDSQTIPAEAIKEKSSEPLPQQATEILTKIEKAVEQIIQKEVDTRNQKPVEQVPEENTKQQPVSDRKAQLSEDRHNFTKVQIRTPTPPTRVPPESVKITAPPQDSTRSVGLKKQISGKEKSTIESVAQKLEEKAKTIQELSLKMAKIDNDDDDWEDDNTKKVVDEIKKPQVPKNIQIQAKKDDDYDEDFDD